MLKMGGIEAVEQLLVQRLLLIIKCSILRFCQLKPVMKRLLLFTTVTCILLGCFGDDEKESKEKKWPAGMVMDVAVIQYPNLQGEAKDEASDDLLFLPPGYPAVEVKKEAGFYVRLVLNNKMLASVFTDGGLWEEADMLNPSNLHALYGKYKNI